jgi:hypothetical protein
LGKRLEEFWIFLPVEGISEWYAEENFLSKNWFVVASTTFGCQSPQQCITICEYKDRITMFLSGNEVNQILEAAIISQPH